MRLKDLIGKRFGMLTVIGRASKSKERQRRALLKCRCDCGVLIEASKTVLEYGSKNNCGCSPKKSQRVDLAGRRYGRLLVLGRAIDSGRKRSNGDIIWDCVCDCGARIKAFSNPLRTGRVKSCGCLRREVSAAIQKACRDVLKIPFPVTLRKRVLKNYKSNAIARKMEWSLNEAQFDRLVYSKCFYCGTSPKVYKSKYGRHSAAINGIDRVDNTLGYSVANCVPCCKVCNYAKNDMSQREFFEWLGRVFMTLQPSLG